MKAKTGTKVTKAPKTSPSPGSRLQLVEPARQLLVEDIDPVPVKERAPLGVVELTLDEGQTVKAVGLVYGLEQQIVGDGYTANVFMDQYNQRIRVYSYEAQDYEALIMKLRWLAEANGFDKIIIMANRRDWERFLRHGYVLEAMLKYFLRGDDAVVMSKFRSQDRLTSHCLMDEILLIEQIMSVPPSIATHTVPDDVQVRLARTDDIPDLIDLYRGIFQTYPTPLVHASYLEQILHAEAVFAVCIRDGIVQAAASAELHPEVLSAELTDCATRPEARGQGLMSILLTTLENEIRNRNYICSYTMARARSHGMNRVFYQLGYEFNGRLVNNCDIHGAYEDMNIWVKDLRKS
jgi:putative beta-lysine N-acetyltransferase